MSALASQKTKISRMSTGGTPAFAHITGATKISIGGGSSTLIDTSTLDSDAKEFMTGLSEEGEVSFDLNIDPKNATHAALIDDKATRTRRQFQIEFVDASTYTFHGYVQSMSIDVAVDAKVDSSFTIKIDGAGTWA
jgi:hypothetical protein